MAAAGASPSSSPRLPSPPPFTEVQIGPKSPSVGESFGKETEEFLLASKVNDDASSRRIRPGTKAADMAVGPPLVPLSQLDSPFQLQEHLKALYNHFTRPEGSETVVPISRDVAIQLAEPPEGVDKSLWLYELCRFLTMKVNNLIVAFFAEDPPCSAQTCPEMRASEWQYLCAVHDPPKSCCAIDYCCHTLDWATNILTSPKHFPSRLTLGSEAGGGAQASLRYLTNIFRRLYRIFAHAWFQHRDVFWQVEGNDGLYIFFKTVCDMYKLIPEDNYTVPAEAEGLDTPSMQEQADDRRMTILRKESEGSLENIEPSSISTGATTRRHKNNPSISSRVTTISEGAEEEEQQKAEPLESKDEESKEAVPEPVPEPESEIQPAEEVGSEEQKEAAEAPANDPAESHVTVEEVQEDEEKPDADTEAATKDEQETVPPEEPEEPESPKAEESQAETQTGAEDSTEATEEEKPTPVEEASTEQTQQEPESQPTTEQEAESATESIKET
ncbi:hypothetical protein CNMCM5793_009178 [Aspergillus hiratsukae]|uniref:Mob1 family protein n=1 Tax=Aspergillus hiratsukae TaxID=1194566 RepID=A0A8H6P8C3_9EURO|nr:hypothetical protein CNMCM5793_009178 [Aspergillus hiratsukae]KAF7160143.1 hypothetical protein CNMCM6106_007603 [Aspergillus hiratsukae]